VLYNEIPSYVVLSRAPKPHSTQNLGSINGRAHNTWPSLLVFKSSIVILVAWLSRLGRASSRICHVVGVWKRVSVVMFGV
jgi:hypothetical protein